MLAKIRTPNRIYFAVFAFFTFCILCVSAVLVIHFIQLNYDYITHPETSPGYNEGAVFGDGGDVWRELGINLPSSLLPLLILVNAAGIVFCFCPQTIKPHIFAVIVLISVCALCNIFHLKSFFYSISFLLIIPELLLIPAALICTIYFFVHRKRILSGHMFLLTLSMTASFILEWFGVFLYLD